MSSSWQTDREIVHPVLTSRPFARYSRFKPARDYRAELERLRAFIRACLRLAADADEVAINAAIAARGGYLLSQYQSQEKLIRSRSH